MVGKRGIGVVGRLLLLVLLTIGVSLLVHWRFPGISRYSDVLFVVGLLEVIAAGGAVWGSPMDTSGSLWQRYLIGIPPNENKGEQQATFLSDMLQKQTFAGQALVCGLFTILFSVGLSFLGI